MIDVSEIKRCVSPIQAIERYTGAKEVRNKYMCPFHNDNHPSLSVKANHWQCWACGEHGDVINFVQKLYGISFKEAAGKIAEDFSLDIEIPEKAKRTIWDDIKIKTDRRNREEVRLCREEIEQSINTITAVHRVLFHLGYEEAAGRYAALLDKLVDADILTAYKLLKEFGGIKHG